MKTLRFLSLFILAAVIFSCEKDVKEEKEFMQDVSFGIKHLEPELKMDVWDWKCIEDEPVSALIQIEDKWYNPLVFYLNGKLYTQAIKLAVSGEVPEIYEVNHFVILSGKLTQEEISVYAHGDPDDVSIPPGTLPNGVYIIKAAPVEGSAFEDYVSKTLPMEITVHRFGKTEEEIEVLCYEPAVYEGFGFNWFLITEIVVKEVCIWGDLCHKDPNFFIDNNTIYNSVFDLNNNTYPFDLPALFQVIVTKGGDEWVFQNYDENTYEYTAPLCVKFPLQKNKATEVVTFELWVYVPVGSDVELVKFKKWTQEAEYGEIDFSDYLNEFGIIEFVIGNCNYNPDENAFVFPPWQNLPEYLTATIVHDWNPGYWSFNYVSFPDEDYDLPNADFSGWCADGVTTITPGSWHHYLFSSMYEELWPSVVKDSDRFTKEKMASINWLVNNLSDFGLPALTGMYIAQGIGLFSAEQGKIIQDAFWLIIHDGLDETPPYTDQDAAKSLEMATAALQVTEYYPLPGGYAAILFVPNNGTVDKIDDLTLDPQMMITIIDP